MRIALKLAYDGARLQGWQRHPGMRTVQGLLEEALAAVGRPTGVHGASRTDAGVHAAGQVCHVDLDDPGDPAALRRALDRALPEDVRVLSAAPAPARFHARWSARGKIYRYVLATPADRAAAGADPFLSGWAWALPDPRAFPALAEREGASHLDVEAMRRALASLLGTRDLRGLATWKRPPGGRKKTTRRMGAARLDTAPWEGGGGGRLYVLTLSGDAFLKHQVRNLAGLLAQVGYGELAAEAVSEVVASRERHHGPRAPGRGLTLLRVRYPAPVDPFRGP